MILIHSGLLLMFLSCVRTKDYVYDYGLANVVTEMETKYSYWPSIHNALRLRKRDVPVNTSVLSEGGDAVNSQPAGTAKTAPQAPAEVKTQPVNPPGNVEQANSKDKMETAKAPGGAAAGHTNETGTAVATSNDTTVNTTLAVAAPKQFDMSSPAVLMRGFVVFGGFVVMAVLYYIFYRTKTNKNDTGNTHNTNDNNQFRYGVLHSEDRRDNLELSRIPLTMESDDDDEDEDLEIFDIEQKKQSLSYVNLQTKDEDIVFQRSTENGSNDKDNLLLDIEDVTTDPLINWNHNGNKSIL